MLKQSLMVLMKSKTSVFIWGSPGGGKSSIVYEIAKELKKTMYEMRALLYEPIDVRGFPKVTEDNKTIYCPPEDLPIGANCLLFVDELNQAPMMTQNSFLQLIIPPHKLGSYKLPTDCGIIAAGNRETDRAGATRMSTALANRFIHLTLDIDVEEWLNWAVLHGVSPEVYAFIRYRGDLLSTFDPSKNDKAFASPRSYEFLSNILKKDLFSLPREAQLEIISGTIGEGPATEFMAFTEIWQSLPNPEDVLKAPNSFSIPNKPAILFALCGALARKANIKNCDAFFAFANRLSGEWSVRLVNDATKMEPKLKNTKGYIQWASKNIKNMI